MNYRRLRIPGGCYFFTVATQAHQPLLLANYERLLRAVSLTQQRHPFSLEAFVVLPDHLHAIWTLPAGDADFSTRWMVLKRLFSADLASSPASTSQRSKREKGLWQRRFWEHALLDEADRRRHMDFIHYDPVRHGYCATPADWPHGSFLSLRDVIGYPAHWPGPGVPDMTGVHVE